MSKFHGAKAGYEAGKQFYSAVKGAVKKAFSKKSPTITKTKPKVGSLTERRKNQDDVVQSAQKLINKKNLTPEGKIAVRKTIAPGMKKISKTQDEIDKLREKKMGGGMMGRRMGYSQGSKKFPDLTGDGKVTLADILKGRGVINGKKKKKA